MRRFLTPRWLLRHLIMVVLVAACLGLGWWQIGRAAGGNALSIGYSFEWPVFALFVIFIWYREIRVARGTPEKGTPEKKEEPAIRVPVRKRPTGDGDESDPQLRAYNDYLAWLNEDPSRRPADYPGARVD